MILFQRIIFRFNTLYIKLFIIVQKFELSDLREKALMHITHVQYVHHMIDRGK